MNWREELFEERSIIEDLFVLTETIKDVVHKTNGIIAIETFDNEASVHLEESCFFRHYQFYPYEVDSNREGKYSKLYLTVNNVTVFTLTLKENHL